MSKSRIILIGYRGSGKTSVGRILADQLWKTFADVDQETCKRFDNKTIAEVWREYGEPAWRKAEVEVTRELCAKPDHVIALGGGTLMQPGARQAVEQAQDTLRVYLACNPKVLCDRIHGDPASAATRPSLTGSGGGLEEIETVLAERDPVYRAVADVVFEVTFTSIQEAARYLLSKHL